MSFNVQPGHPLQAPVSGGSADQKVQLLPVFAHTQDQLSGKVLDGLAEMKILAYQVEYSPRLVRIEL
jgi:hypothetical protein